MSSLGVCMLVSIISFCTLHWLQLAVWQVALALTLLMLLVFITSFFPLLKFYNLSTSKVCNKQSKEKRAHEVKYSLDSVPSLSSAKFYFFHYDMKLNLSHHLVLTSNLEMLAFHISLNNHAWLSDTAEISVLQIARLN